MMDLLKLKIVSICFILIILLFSVFMNAKENDEKNIVEKKSLPKNISELKALIQISEINDFSQKYIYSDFIEDKRAEKNYKSPWLAFFLSYIFPGGGQWYNGDYTKALIMEGLVAIGLGAFIAAAMSTNFDSENNTEYIDALGYTGAIVGGSAWLWSIIDAPISANIINDEISANHSISKSILEIENYKMKLSAGKFNNRYNITLTINYGL